MTDAPPVASMPAECICALPEWQVQRAVGWRRDGLGEQWHDLTPGSLATAWAGYAAGTHEMAQARVPVGRAVYFVQLAIPRRHRRRV